MIFNGRMSRIPPIEQSERGVASIIGFLIIMGALIGFSTVVLTGWGRSASSRASGLIDVMRQAEQRQKQLVTLVYSWEDSSGIHAYLFNYGSVEAVVDRVWLGTGDVANEVDPTFSSTDYLLPPKKLVEMVVENPPEGNKLVILTESDTLYSWEISRE